MNIQGSPAGAGVQ